MIDRVRALVQVEGLHLFGGFHPEAADGVPGLPGTVLIVGNVGSAIYPRLLASQEQGQPDPVDRWTGRIVGGIAREVGAAVLYPFDGPPFHPFQRWAMRADARLSPSPLGLLVHERFGLWHALRAALLFEARLELEDDAASGGTCASCVGRPCMTACPVGAFRPQAYDVAGCRGHLSTLSGQDCMMFGCAARRACPVGREFAYVQSHAALHMRAFRAKR